MQGRANINPARVTVADLLTKVAAWDFLQNLCVQKQASRGHCHVVKQKCTVKET